MIGSDKKINIIKKIVLFNLIILFLTGCNTNSSSEDGNSNLTGESFILSLVNCDDAYISRKFNGYDGHKGIDIAAPEGADIYAADNGIVQKSVTMNMGYGNHIIIDHGDYQTLYAHCSSFADFNVGDSVSKGDIIAFVGNTGNSTGRHLHFEVIVNEIQHDPITWFK